MQNAPLTMQTTTVSCYHKSSTGVGFPPGLDFRDTKTLGLRLVVMLVKQLNGNIELERAKKGRAGTTFTIEFDVRA